MHYLAKLVVSPTLDRPTVEKGARMLLQSSRQAYFTHKLRENGNTSKNKDVFVNST